MCQFVSWDKNRQNIKCVFYGHFTNTHTHTALVEPQEVGKQLCFHTVEVEKSVTVKIKWDKVQLKQT